MQYFLLTRCALWTILTMQNSRKLKTMSQEEITIFENNFITVTNARYIRGGQTYAMRNVTSVETFVQKPNYIMAIIVLWIGIAIANALFEVGFIIIIAAVLYFILKKKIYYVTLTTSSGQVRALETKDIEYANQVVSAVNQAIIAGST